MSAPPKRTQEVSPDGDAQQSIGNLLGELSRDMSQLVRQEVQLAKAELRQDVKKTGRAAGMFGGGGFAGYMTLLFASIAGWWGLANVMDQGYAALIVAAVWAVVAAVLLLVGRAQARHITALRQTTTTVGEVPGVLKPGHDQRKERS
jgi:hypothetical protein